MNESPESKVKLSGVIFCHNEGHEVDKDPGFLFSLKPLIS